MDKRATMKISIHPLFLLLLFLMIFYGNIALYSMIILSLLWHEFGHMIAAKLVGAKIERCVILPYGGEITLKNESQLTYSQLTYIAIGGPIATSLGIVLAFFFPNYLSTPVIQIQLVLLLVNMLPIWPLDGGKILCFQLLRWSKKIKVYEMIISGSFYLLSVLIIVLLYLLPSSLSLFLISLFLWIKVIAEWRIRKYRSAFEKHVLNRLT